MTKGTDDVGARSDERAPTHREVWALIFATYRATLPAFLAFLGGIVLATWIVTTLLW